MLCQKLLFFLLKPFLELVFDFLLLVFQLLLQIKEAFVNVFHLLKFEPLQLFLHLFQ